MYFKIPYTVTLLGQWQLSYQSKK